MLRRKLTGGMAVVVMTGLALAMLGAGPRQEGVPPQPFFADYFSGVVLVQGVPAPMGTRLVACVDGCETFQSQAVPLTSGGSFNLLQVNPTNRFLRGDPVTFYLVNQYGRIQAAESVLFEGAYAIFKLNLTFDQPLPAPLPPPGLPQVGDPVLPLLPQAALVLGSLLLAGGMAVLALSRRRRVEGVAPWVEG